MIQWFAAIAVFSIALAADAEASGPEAVIIENPTLRLVFDNQGKARSLLYKPTREELLAPRVRVPAFSLTQLRPYNAQLQLSLPAKTTVFPVVALRREADRLFADFGPVDLEAEICVRTTDAYIALTLEKVVYRNRFPYRYYEPATADEVTFLQLPLAARKNFGDWLNVLWDDALVVNLYGDDGHDNQ